MTKVVKMNQKKMKKVTVDGMMTYGMDENGLHTADFANFDGAKGIEAFEGKCRVRVMRDGNLYLNELPKPIRKGGKKLFREDNSTLTLGRNHFFYFEFILAEELLDELPDKLVLQAGNIAKKVTLELKKREFIKLIG